MDQLVEQHQNPESQTLPIISVTIDESWVVSNQSGMKENLLTCPICYCIPIGSPVQCSKCERIFCRNDYDKVLLLENPEQKRCPTCKLSPWRKKQQIHISYKHMFDSLSFKCKICQGPQQTFTSQMQSETMSKDELINHLQKTHNMTVSAEQALFDFILVKQGEEVKLSQFQNLEINVKRRMGLQKFDIGAPNGKIYGINLRNMTARTDQHGQCQIKTVNSKTLKKNKQYIVWTVNMAENFRQSFVLNSQQEEGHIQPPANNPSSFYVHSPDHRYLFYSEQLQPVIEKNYQEFSKNIRINVFCMDVKEYRYLINFSAMTQTNTFTKNRKPILRVPITLK